MPKLKKTMAPIVAQKLMEKAGQHIDSRNPSGAFALAVAAFLQEPESLQTTKNPTAIKQEKKLKLDDLEIGKLHGKSATLVTDFHTEPNDRLRNQDDVLEVESQVTKAYQASQKLYDAIDRYQKHNDGDPDAIKFQIQRILAIGKTPAEQRKITVPNEWVQQIVRVYEKYDALRKDGDLGNVVKSYNKITNSNVDINPPKAGNRSRSPSISESKVDNDDILARTMAAAKVHPKRQQPVEEKKVASTPLADGNRSAALRAKAQESIFGVSEQDKTAKAEAEVKLNAAAAAAQQQAELRAQRFQILKNVNLKKSNLQVKSTVSELKEGENAKDKAFEEAKNAKIEEIKQQIVTGRQLGGKPLTNIATNLDGMRSDGEARRIIVKSMQQEPDSAPLLGKYSITPLTNFSSSFRADPSPTAAVTSAPPVTPDTAPSSESKQPDAATVNNASSTNANLEDDDELEVEVFAEPTGITSDAEPLSATPASPEPNRVQPVNQQEFSDAQLVDAKADILAAAPIAPTPTMTYAEQKQQAGAALTAERAEIAKNRVDDGAELSNMNVMFENAGNEFDQTVQNAQTAAEARAADDALTGINMTFGNAENEFDQTVQNAHAAAEARAADDALTGIDTTFGNAENEFDQTVQNAQTTAETRAADDALTGIDTTFGNAENEFDQTVQDAAAAASAQSDIPAAPPIAPLPTMTYAQQRDEQRQQAAAAAAAKDSDPLTDMNMTFENAEKEFDQTLQNAATATAAAKSADSSTAPPRPPKPNIVLTQTVPKPAPVVSTPSAATPLDASAPPATAASATATAPTTAATAQTATPTATVVPPVLPPRPASAVIQPKTSVAAAVAAPATIEINKDFAIALVKTTQAAVNQTALARIKTQMESMRLKQVEFSQDNFRNLGDREKLKTQWEGNLKNLLGKIAENTSRLQVAQEHLPACGQLLMQDKATTGMAKDAAKLQVQAIESLKTYEKMWQSLTSMQKSVTATNEVDYSDRIKVSATKIINVISTQNKDPASLQEEVNKSIQSFNDDMKKHPQPAALILQGNIYNDSAKVNVKQEIAIMSIAGNEKLNKDSTKVNKEGVVPLNLNTVYTMGPNTNGNFTLTVQSIREDLNTSALMTKFIMDKGLTSSFPTLANETNANKVFSQLRSMCDGVAGAPPSVKAISEFLQAPADGQPRCNAGPKAIQQLATLMHKDMQQSLCDAKNPAVPSKESLMLAQKFVEDFRDASGGQRIVIRGQNENLKQAVKYYCEAMQKLTKDPDIKKQYGYYDPNDNTKIKTPVLNSVIDYLSISNLVQSYRENKKVNAAVTSLKSQDDPKGGYTPFADRTNIHNSNATSELKKSTTGLEQAVTSLKKIESQVAEVQKNPQLQQLVEERVSSGPGRRGGSTS
jgi:hypothetical protein